MTTTTANTDRDSFTNADGLPKCLGETFFYHVLLELELPGDKVVADVKETETGIWGIVVWHTRVTRFAGLYCTANTQIYSMVEASPPADPESWNWNGHVHRVSQLAQAINFKIIRMLYAATPRIEY